MEDSLALAAALAMPTLGQLPTPHAGNTTKPEPVRLPLPAPSNQEWVNWRITQVSQLVRRIYLESKAINPKVKISAAVVTWGHPPTSEADFINSSAMEWVFQDWRSWLQQGALDMVFPMNYLPEHRELMRTWFDGWISWEKQHKYGRQVVVGLGANVNTPAELVAQIHRVRQTEGSNRADGIAFFSYDNLLHPPAPAASAAATAPSAVATNAALPGKTIAPARGYVPRSPWLTWRRACLKILPATQQSAQAPIPRPLPSRPGFPSWRRCILRRTAGCWVWPADRMENRSMAMWLF